MAACAGDIPVTPPTPSPAASAACAALAAELPAQVAGRKRVATSPLSDLTAAWGDPVITLRCGVGRPPQLGPTSELVTVGAPGVDEPVDWFPIELTEGYRFITTGRVASVEIDVPAAYAPEAGQLVDLAEAITNTIPLSADPVSANPSPSSAPS